MGFAAFAMLCRAFKHVLQHQTENRCHHETPHHKMVVHCLGCFWMICSRLGRLLRRSGLSLDAWVRHFEIFCGSVLGMFDQSSSHQLARALLYPGPFWLQQVPCAMALASIDARAVRTAGRTLLTSIAQQPSSPARNKEARESTIPLKQAHQVQAYDFRSDDSRASSRGLPNHVRRLRSLNDDPGERRQGSASAPVNGFRGFRRASRMDPNSSTRMECLSRESQMPRTQTRQLKSGYRRASATASLCRTACEAGL